MKIMSKTSAALNIFQSKIKKENNENTAKEIDT